MSRMLDWFTRLASRYGSKARERCTLCSRNVNTGRVSKLVSSRIFTRRTAGTVYGFDEASRRGQAPRRGTCCGTRPAIIDGCLPWGSPPRRAPHERPCQGRNQLAMVANRTWLHAIPAVGGWQKLEIQGHLGVACEFVNYPTLRVGQVPEGQVAATSATRRRSPASSTGRAGTRSIPTLPSTPN
jgi:hypothetical protein